MPIRRSDLWVERAEFIGGLGTKTALCLQSCGKPVGFRHNSTSVNHFFPMDEHYMRLALREADRAAEHGDVPVGAVITFDGEVIATGRNERELRGDPTAHAEIIALREAATKIGNWRLLDTVLYVTLEPCAMCAGAIVLSRVPRVVFATTDPKAGAAGSVFDVLAEPQLNHRPEVQSGLFADEAAQQLRDYFVARRG